MLYLLIILLPVLASLVIKFKKESYLKVSVITNILTFLVSIGLVFSSSDKFILFSATSTLDIAFMIDGMGKLFLVLVTFVFMLVSIYNTKYLSHEVNQVRFTYLMLLTVSSLAGLILSANLFTLYLFFEAMTLLTFPLVLNSGTKESIMASFKYLAYSIFGATLALAGFFILSANNISLDFVAGGSIKELSSILMIAYFLMALGFSAKAGMMPLHAWLPIAHPVAPSSASAVLSGIITKMGVFAIIRVSFYIYSPSILNGTKAQTILLSLAILTIFVGSMLASREKNLKKRLAFSSVSQVSYALFGIFLFNEIGLIGALLQVVYHALSKNALFLTAGSIIFNSGKTLVSDLTGLGKAYPLTFALFFINGLSLIGVPPTGGFVSKEFLAHASLTTPLNTLGVIVLLISALLTAYYMIEPVVLAFKGKHARMNEKNALTFSILSLTLVMLVLACLPSLIIMNLESFIGLLF